MKGDPGPYMNDDGDIWVPRTVPWRLARAVAAEGIQDYDQYPAYVGKSNAELLGFTRDCSCDEVCEARFDSMERETGQEPCRVPAWHFEVAERRR